MATPRPLPKRRCDRLSPPNRLFHLPVFPFGKLSSGAGVSSVLGLSVAIGVLGLSVAIGVLGLSVANGVLGSFVAIGVLGTFVAIGVLGLSVAIGVPGLSVAIGVPGLSVMLGVTVLLSIVSFGRASLSRVSSAANARWFVAKPSGVADLSR